MKTMGIVVVAALAAIGRRVASSCSNHVDLAMDQFGCQRWKSIHSILGPSIFDGHCLTLDIAGLSQALAESA